MKSLYATLISSMLVSPLCFNAFAQQQLPNSDFEGAWVDCVPWNSSDNAKTKGQQPADWCISHVIGIGGLGATEVGSNVDGYNSTAAVELRNSPNSLMATQKVPSYITLGKTWSTAQGFAASNKDGGSFGGIEFTSRPVGMEFMYKRTRGEDNPDETTTIVAYVWKGHWSQADVPGDISLGSTTKTTMVDRDRCVLGMDMTGCQGGEVTKSDDAELIAVLKAEITENTDEWTKFSGKFEYYSDATPEMINVIIAAGDYFGGASVVGKDNTLVVDDVKLTYGNETQSYPGYLNVEMMGEKIADNDPAVIEITPTGDGKCTFILPDLTLSLGGSPMALGDIKVEDVEMTEANGVTTYTGKVDGLVLSNGLTADVVLNGTITATNEVDMKIDVTWMNTPINVTFTSSNSAISSIEADENAPVEFFNLQGIRVNGSNMTPGVYVKRQGSKVSKVLVR